MSIWLLDLPAEADLAAFRRQLLAWYDVHKRNLPWRGDPDPYHILVSEVMLQQTQVDRVIPKYIAFLERFPTLQSLAEATPADVIRQWQGLGYNRRALNLKRLADAVAKKHDYQLPHTIKELEELPGVGLYTASAVACFAFGAQVAVVDTNVRRVLSGVVGRDLSLREAGEVSISLLPPGRAADWNQALMDYGALVYRSRPARTVKKRQRPFEETNRFWRGRIVDALREQRRLPVARLLQQLAYPNRDETRVRTLVVALHEDGLVDYDARTDTVRLPS